ncbi:MAG TPA: 2-hydroxyacyl-CoA dehydratase family protein [Candidatus Lokiarchaeia archaeon]|nr:2-hydroxyacyl-CoA dehydratase family protein [Candidatus Lokiarchaeia archaeon]
MSETTTASGQAPAGPPRKRVERLQATNQLGKIIKGYLVRTSMASKLPWKKTAWITAGFPAELCYMFGITPVHPENAACISGSAKISLKLIEYAESLGFSRDLCSYFKTNVGAVGKKVGPAQGGINKPTFLASTNTICDTHVKWFQTQAREFGVPYFQFDTPNAVSGIDDEHMEEYIDYMADQVHEFMDFATKLTGKKLTEKRYNEVLEKSARLSDLWQEIYEYRKLVPTPVSFQDTMAAIFPLVILPGLDIGIKFYEALLKDIKARVASNTGAVTKEEEKYRVLFEGIPMWYKISFFHQLANYGAIVTYEPYTFSFGPKKKTGLPMEQMIRELARLIIDTPYNYSVEKRIKYFENVIDEYKINGVILHSNMSCRPSCTGMIDLKNAIQNDKGIPVWLMDCDMDDPRAYAEEPMQNRMESFIELMAANKK